MEDSVQTPVEEEGNEEKEASRGRREKVRANSTTLVELWADKLKDEKEKKVRHEEEDMIRDIFKRSNKIIRTPLKLGEDEKEMEEEVEEVKKECEKGEESTGNVILMEIREMIKEMTEERKEMKREILNLKSKIIEVEERDG